MILFAPGLKASESHKKCSRVLDGVLARKAAPLMRVEHYKAADSTTSCSIGNGKHYTRSLGQPSA